MSAAGPVPAPGWGVGAPGASLVWTAAQTLGLGVPACAREGVPRPWAVIPAASHEAPVASAGTRRCGAGDARVPAAGEVEGDLGLDLPRVRFCGVAHTDPAAHVLVAPVGATARVAAAGERASNALDVEVLP